MIRLRMFMIFMCVAALVPAIAGAEPLSLSEAVLSGAQHSVELAEAAEALRLVRIQWESSRFPGNTSIGIVGGFGGGVSGTDSAVTPQLDWTMPAVSLSASFLEELSAAFSYQPPSFDGKGQNGSFSVDWRPYDAGAITARKKEQRSLALEELNYQQALLDFEFKVKEQFVALYNQQEELEYARTGLAIQNRRYEAAKNRLAAGLISAREAEDLLRSGIAEEIALFEQEQQYLDAREEFARFIGISLSDRTLAAPALDTVVADLVLPERSELIEAVGDSLEYRRALDARDAAQWDLDVANQWWVPELGLQAHFRADDGKDTDLPFRWNTGAKATLGFSFSGRDLYTVESAEITLKQAERALDDAAYGLERAVDSAFYRHTVMLRKLELAEYTLELEEKELHRVRFNFEQGTVFEDDVKAAEITVLQAKQQIRSREFEIYMSWLGLRRMAGYPISGAAE